MGMSLGPYAEFSKQFEKSRVGRWMLRRTTKHGEIVS